MTDIKPWPRTPLAQQISWRAEWQHSDRSWQPIDTDISLKQAIRAAINFRKRSPDTETRVTTER